jgi:hypothetical protein
MTLGQYPPPYKTAGLVLSLAMIGLLVLVYRQFRGAFLDREKLTRRSRGGPACRWTPAPGQL